LGETTEAEQPPANLTPELALEPANLTLESFNPVDRGILSIGRGRQQGRTEQGECSHCTAFTAAVPGFTVHARLPLLRNTPAANQTA